MRRVTVALSERSYDVCVGSGAVAHLPEFIPASARRVVVVSQPGIPVDVGPHLGDLDVHRVDIGDGEAAKTLATVEAVCREFVRAGLNRGDVVIGVGGGLVTDVAGFAASIYHRGLPVVHVSTTLLGQVDAAIGGKTGVNLPEGKNLVGAFWQPDGVICDTDHLTTLPERERLSGLGEVAKYHFLANDDEHLDGSSFDDQVATCVQIKARVVAADERESISSDNRKGRATLNYGHTLAHAIETAGGYGLRHGECVAIGLLYAAAVARRLDRIDDDRVAYHREVLDRFALVTRLPDGLGPNDLVPLFGRDKKAIAGVTFVLDGPNGVEQVEAVPQEAILDAFEEIT